MARLTSGRRPRFTLACLLAAILCLGLFLWPGTDPDSSGTVDEAAAGDVVALVNAARAIHAQPALRVDSRLTRAAESYARAMGSADWFDHVGPEGTTLVQRAEAAGYANWAYLGENLARGAGQASPADVVAAWMASPGHRENLLSPALAETGIGCFVRSQPEHRFWCVQALGGSP